MKYFEKGFATKREVSDIVKAEIGDKVDDIVINIIDEQRNEPNGLAGLDANGKLAISQIPGGVQQLQSQSWDASTNTPNLLTIEKQAGFIWLVGTTGNTSLSGITDWQNGDYVIYLGNNTFSKIDNTDNTSLQILNNLSDLSNKTTARTNLDVYSTSQVDTALNTKENNIASGTVSQYWRGDKTFQTLDKNAVGLANVDNTSDANKPVSTATQTALNLKADKVVGAVANNFASLNSTGNLIDSGKKSSDFEPADITILKEEDVINNLTSTDTNKPLSANQGKVLQDNKADKVSGATNGNFASLNSSGNLIDSTKKPSDFEPADVNILKKSNVIDNLTSTNIDLPLSANQGKVLQDGKVDKITGKGLSTNDFDNTYKAQLDNFTENSQDAVASTLTDTATIDLTYNDELNQITADVKDGSINNVKIGTNADISTSKIKQAVITPQVANFSNNDTQDIINNKAQGQITNLENLINTRPIGASNGSVYYLTSQASAIPNYELLSFSPDNSPLDVESITITSTTPKIDRLFHSYISTYEVGNTIINGGNWIFNFYGYTSHINNNNFEIDVYKRDSSGTETLLFTCDTSNLLQTSQISPELNVANVEITNQDFSCNTTDKIVVKIYAKTDRSVATTITLLHSGTDYASHIHTPIIATHNQLAGTQGGSATEKYHLILSDYNKVLALDTSFSLKEDVANKTTAFSATPANIKYPTEKLVKDNLDLKGNITDTRQESTRFVEKTYGLDTNDGLTIFKAFKTPERGWTDVNPSGQVKIIGGAEHTVNHTFASSKQSIKTILDNGAKISGTINLVSGNTSMQFFNGKISATINDNSTGTCYFNGVDLSGSIINFNGAGYKYISNSSSAPTLINFANLSGGATATATLININGGAISIGDGWTIIKTNSTLAITSKSSSAVLYDSNFFVINAVITSQVALNTVLSSGLAGLYIVNFASPTGITGISKGDIIYRVGGNNVIVNKFFDAPSSVSVANGISFDTWIKQANDNWVIGSISSSSRLDASNIADGSISNTEFQYLNNVSSNIQTQLDGKLNTTLKGANNGLAELDSTGKVPSSQLPAYVDDVLEFDNFASFPATGEAGKIYVAKDTNIVYRWGGTQYIEISSSLALGETSSTAYRGDRGKIAYDHSQTTGNPHSTTKADVGLGNVDNTADANKNVLSATKLTTARNINGVSFDGTADITIADNTKEPAFTKNTAFNKNFGTTTDTVAEGNDARLGTKNIDETNIANNRIQVYNSTSGKLEYQDKPVGSTNLAIANKTSTTLDITSDTGNDATIPEATNTEAGLLSASDKVKLNNTSGTNTGDQDLSGLMVKAQNLGDVANRQTSLNNITDVSSATNEYVLTKDTATGNAIFKPSVGGGSASTIATTATTGGTTTLTASSANIQRFTGTAGQILVLPDATTLTNAKSFDILNDCTTATGAISIRTNGGAYLTLVPQTGKATIILEDNGTTAGVWSVEVSVPNISGLTIINSANSFVAGQYLTNGASTYVLAQSNSQTTLPCIARVISANANQYAIFTSGVCSTNLGLDSGLTANTSYIISNITAGAVIAYPTTPSNGQLIQPVFEASSATSGVFNSLTVSTWNANTNILKINNAIINGDFNVWQRGTSFTFVANNTYTADRWLYLKNGSMVHDIILSSDVPTVAQAGRLFSNSLRINCTTVDSSIISSDYATIKQKIEGYNFLPLAQKEITLSFWVKATKTGVYSVALTNGGDDRSCVKEINIIQSNTWEKKAITFSASPSSGTWNYTDGIGLQLSIVLAGGSSFQTTPNTWQTGNYLATSNQVNACDSTSNVFYITGIQLESGSVANFFENRTIQQELQLCQRYYHTELSYVAPEINSLSLTKSCFPMIMRSAPIVAGGGTGFTEVVKTNIGITYHQTTAGAQNLTFNSEL